MALRSELGRRRIEAGVRVLAAVRVRVRVRVRGRARVRVRVRVRTRARVRVSVRVLAAGVQGAALRLEALALRLQPIALDGVDVAVGGRDFAIRRNFQREELRTGERRENIHVSELVCGQRRAEPAAAATRSDVHSGAVNA